MFVDISPTSPYGMYNIWIFRLFRDISRLYILLVYSVSYIVYLPIAQFKL